MINAGVDARRTRESRASIKRCLGLLRRFFFMGNAPGCKLMIANKYPLSAGTVYLYRLAIDGSKGKRGTNGCLLLLFSGGLLFGTVTITQFVINIRSPVLCDVFGKMCVTKSPTRGGVNPVHMPSRQRRERFLGALEVFCNQFNIGHRYFSPPSIT